ncbi:MAG: hypothetical protein K2X74_00845, partial [Acetobacteraceae bacterium]|nr:hypothetical protein [Acetobacteraceae bacterium]
MNASIQPPPARRGGGTAPAAAAWRWRCAAALPTLGFLLVVLAPPVNHDAAAVLGFAERWLAGERLYADLIDVNPPLIFLLNLAPAALGAWTPLGPVAALQLCLLALCALSVLLCLRV